ncbi:MAG: ACT domain-containing protein [Candidatus Binatia bacterium]|nr:ACT domain-containing protein [Candidatus Binatia bacterium]
MKTSLVLTCIGPDRPGLVGSLSQVVADHDGNWVESRMARLAGKFAGLLRVEIPAERADELTHALGALGADGFRITVEPTEVEDDRATRLLRLSIVGRDRAGIVRDISGVLAAHCVNVEELETSCTSAPESGEPLFQAKASLHVPSTVSTAALRDGLEEIANDLMVDVDLETA